jgi:hypothetical protein
MVHVVRISISISISLNLPLTYLRQTHTRTLARVIKMIFPKYAVLIAFLIYFFVLIFIYKIIKVLYYDTGR